MDWGSRLAWTVSFTESSLWTGGDLGLGESIAQAHFNFAMDWGRRHTSDFSTTSHHLGLGEILEAKTHAWYITPSLPVCPYPRP